MKNINKITGITLLLLSLAIPAFAWGPGMGPGFGHGQYWNYDNYYNRLSRDEIDKLDELRATLEDKTKEAGNEIIKKQIDLNAELEKDSPDIKKAKAIQNEINDLEAKIDEAHLEFIVDAKKINPDIPFGPGSRMGRGARGGNYRGR
ncbi:MAG: periplasmic heavy metal sensor [Deltaproteobacteria bacterium]|nr:periplasmic heavy metal sensor [Deltaproteobacteria bacterium]